MIAIVSSAPQEASALGSLCEERGWNCIACHSVQSAKRAIGRVALRVALLRYQLDDGFSDDIIRTLPEANIGARAKIIVLLPAGTPSSIEARQIALGADCVQRDPIRSEVLLAYIDKYIRLSSSRRGAAQAKPILFSGAALNRSDRSLRHGGRTVRLTPREVNLIELLSTSVNEVVTYELLYNEILGRRFRGDTSNMRVLLAKLSTSIRKIGVTLRHCVDVIPKTGYRYHLPVRFSAASGHEHPTPAQRSAVMTIDRVTDK
jgi:DNA-binding response OmpR family regulator